MGLLDKLWDDTVAGPRPDNGLSKLRKYASFSPSSAPPPAADVPISRSITILRTSSLRNDSPHTGSNPSSPAGSSAPESPFAPTTPRADTKKPRRKAAVEGEEPRSPTGYDWIVMSALDR